MDTYDHESAGEDARGVFAGSGSTANPASLPKRAVAASERELSKTNRSG